MELSAMKVELDDGKVKRSKKEKDAEDLSNRLDYLSKELAARDARIRELT
jgi:hypothetical protein